MYFYIFFHPHVFLKKTEKMLFKHTYQTGPYSPGWIFVAWYPHMTQKLRNFGIYEEKLELKCRI